MQYSSHVSTPHSAVSYQRRLLRLPEVMLRTGFGRSHIYNLMRTEQFPAAIKLGRRAVAWDSLEIDSWITERIQASRSPDLTAAVH